jgi:hypothetical protein
MLQFCRYVLEHFVICCRLGALFSLHSTIPQISESWRFWSLGNQLAGRMRMEAVVSCLWYHGESTNIREDVLLGWQVTRQGVEENALAMQFYTNISLLSVEFHYEDFPQTSDCWPTPNAVRPSRILSTLSTETAHSTETSVPTRPTRQYILQDDTLHSHSRDTLKSYVLIHNVYF